MNQSLRHIAPVAGIVLISVACKSPEPPPPAPEPVMMTPPRPMLVAGNDEQMTLFGELPEVPPQEYEARSAVSLRQHSDPSEGSDFDPTLSRTGDRIIFASTRHSLSPDIYYKDADGVAVTQLTTDPAADVQPALSPDGRRVAFASNRSGNWDIWVINIDGQQPIQVTTTASHEVHPSWSPDGSQLVFCSMPERGGQWELWIASATAAAVKKFIGYGLFPEWAPDSNTILYQRARRRGSRWFSLWTLKIVNGEPRMPTEILSSPDHAMILPTWSPDEKQIAYCAVDSVSGLGDDLYSPFQRADIWMVDIDGRGKVLLTDGMGANYSPAWSSQGRIFFTSDRCSEDASKECIWSVIPLRAPLAAQEFEVNEVYGRDDAARADELAAPVEPARVETVGWPREPDTVAAPGPQQSAPMDSYGPPAPPTAQAQDQGQNLLPGRGMPDRFDRLHEKHPEDR